MSLLIRLLYGLLLSAALLSPVSARAQESGQLQLEEQKIKAGLIYNFLKYTDWPNEDASKPLQVCVFGGADPFSGYLRPMESRTVHQRDIVVRHIDTIGGTASCDMLFVSAEDSSSWPALRAAIKGRDVLTVGDFSGFSSAGGMIEFDTRSSRVEIRLNLAAVSAGRLKIYDNLRRLARTTQSAPASKD